MSTVRGHSSSAVSFQGVPAAPGLTTGPVLIWQKREVSVSRRTGQDPAQQRALLDQAIKTARAQIESICKKLVDENHPDEAAVFSAHEMLVEDRSLLKKVDLALAGGLNAEAAWFDSVEAFAGQLENLSDPTLRLRAADLRDVGERVLRILVGEERDSEIVLPRPSVIVARDLAPSETVSLNKHMVLGFCTAQGGPTSHTAILAKALGLPAVVGLGEEIVSLHDGTVVLVDGNSGEVTADPDETMLAAFQTKILQRKQQSNVEFIDAMAPATTLDGKHFEVVANIGNLGEASTALQFGAEGVGLLRTEFLFLGRGACPDEEEQTGAYKGILDVMGELPVVVRTIDAGGDKEIPYLHQAREANPFLGWRAVRLCLSEPEFFKQQLRALLRASLHHNMRIMFPMISTLQEVRQAKNLLAEARSELEKLGIPMAPRIQVGIMVDIPSVAIQADLFAKEVDFFSVGTNDLTQYSLAADRTNPKLAHLNDPCSPAVLRLMRASALAAHERGIWIGVCGELAGDPDAIPILIGLGVDELSMSPTLIPAAKSLIRRWRYDRAQQVAENTLNLESAEAVREYVRSTAP